MSIGAIIPQVQAAAASAGIIKNILAGLSPKISGLSATAILSKDIDGFEFDYIGEERLEAAAEITDHYTEANDFMQDHHAIKPTIITMRGFVADTAYNRTALGLRSILALSSALATVQPYIGQYSPGTSAKMTAAITQTDQIINQLAQIQGIARSITKLIPGPRTTKVQKAYNTLDSLRRGAVPFAVVTPWATFGDIPDNGHGPMLIESLQMISPSETRGEVDIIVKMKEIRVAPSLIPVQMVNGRGGGPPTNNGTLVAPKAQ